MNENIYVTAVKVAKGKIELEYVDLDDNRPYSTEEKDTPHPDLYNALKKLVPFLATVYYVSSSEDKISINGFSSGKDSSFIVIKGMLTVSSGKKVAINSDAIDVEKEVYGFEQDLDDAITNIQSEADSFFFGNKRATTQEELDFKEGDISQEQKNKDIQEHAESQQQEVDEPTFSSKTVPSDIGSDKPIDGKMAAAEPEEHDPREDPVASYPTKDSLGEPGMASEEHEPQENIPDPESGENNGGVPGL